MPQYIKHTEFDNRAAKRPKLPRGLPVKKEPKPKPEPKKTPKIKPLKKKPRVPRGKSIATETPPTKRGKPDKCVIVTGKEGEDLISFACVKPADRANFLNSVNRRRKKMGLKPLGREGFKELREQLQAKGVIVEDLAIVDRPLKLPDPSDKILTRRDAEFIRKIVEEGLTPAQAWRATRPIKTKTKNSTAMAFAKLQQPHIKKAIEKARAVAEVALSPVITKEANLVQLLNILRTNPGDYFQIEDAPGAPDGFRVKFTAFDSLTEEQLMQIQEFKLQINKDGSKSIAFRFHDRLKAIETLNRMMDWNPQKGTLEPPKRDEHVVHHVLHVPTPVRDEKDYDRSLIENQQWLLRESRKLLEEDFTQGGAGASRNVPIDIPVTPPELGREDSRHYDDGNGRDRSDSGSFDHASDDDGL